MDLFCYRGGRLFAEDVNVERIAAEVGTPAYIYSEGTFVDHLRKMQEAYRVWRQPSAWVEACRQYPHPTHGPQASGFDIVSGGELYRALQAGADPAKVVYAGVGKTDAEIVQALQSGIAYFNIESEQELENLIRLVKQHSTGPARVVKAALRVNPDVDYKTHAYMTTGKKETKIGVDIERAFAEFEKYGKNRSVQLRANHVHLGTGARPSTRTWKQSKDPAVIDQLRPRGMRSTCSTWRQLRRDYETQTVPSAEGMPRALSHCSKPEPQTRPSGRQKHLCQRRDPLTRVLYANRGPASGSSLWMRA
jgi:diaminopimelate decarboxylase